MWNSIAAKCQKGRLDFPSPEKMLKLVCEVASEKMIETAAVDGICRVIKADFHSPPLPLCEAMVQRLWKRVVAKCPKGRASLTFPSPQEIEQLVCEIATQ